MKKFLKAILYILPYAIMLLVIAFLTIYVFKTFDKNLKSYDSIATGIVSGVVTALLILIFQIVWKRNINVWFENLLYQDVHIEGEWTGYLIPFIGIKDLDRIQRQLAFRSFRENLRREKNEQTHSAETFETEAEVVDNTDQDNTSNNENIKAEVIVHTQKKPDEKDETASQKNENKPKRIVVETTIAIKPITVRFEIKRSGHKIAGRLIEVAGTNQINSYNVDGLFKNLILSGTYETFNKENMDRGAFSLMLLDNGKKMEGFFSVYNDDDHSISPMQCILRKQNKLADKNEQSD